MDQQAITSQPLPRDAADSGFSFVDLLAVMLKHRRLIIGIPLLLAAVSAVVILARPRTYTASASLMPEQRDAQTSRVTGLAAQFGVNLLTGANATRSPSFYADLLHSSAVLAEVAAAPVNVPGAGRASMTVADVYEVPKGDSATRTVRAVEMLRDKVSTSIGRETGIVTFTVTAPTAWFARDVALLLVGAVNTFNLQSRRASAAQERAFVQARLAEARAELLQSEGALEDFLRGNRQFDNSPELRFTQQRLQRQVDLRQQLFLQLSQALEQVRLEEVRNTPVVTLVERPVQPIRPDSRNLSLKLIVALIVGEMIAITLALSVELLNRLAETHPEQWAELRRVFSGVRTRRAKASIARV